MNEALQVGFNPVPAAERVARWSAIIHSRLIQLGVVGAILVALWFLKRSWLETFWYLALITIVLGVAWILGATALWWLAKRDLAALPEGPAMTIGRDGVTARGEHTPWSDVTALRTRAQGPWRSPLLLVERRTGAPVRLPLDYLDRTGGELDNAVRAYSQGRLGVDLTGAGA